MACQEGSNAQETSKAVLALGFLIVKKKRVMQTYMKFI